LQIKTKIASCHTGDSKPVKQEVNSTVILPPSLFPGSVFSGSGLIIARATVYFDFVDGKESWKMVEGREKETEKESGKVRKERQ
jgi:hypothetical protein